MTRVGAKEVRGIIEHFENLPEPRSSVNQRHLLVDIIVISICGVIAGADGPTGIEQWAKAQLTWLKKYLRLPNGIPSHDTIGRVLEALDPESFQEFFAGWVASLSDDGNENKEKHLALDGKTLRRSHDRSRGFKALHLVREEKCHPSFEEARSVSASSFLGVPPPDAGRTQRGSAIAGAVRLRFAPFSSRPRARSPPWVPRVLQLIAHAARKTFRLAVAPWSQRRRVLVAAAVMLAARPAALRNQ